MRVLNFAFTLTPNLKFQFKTHSLSNKHSGWKIGHWERTQSEFHTSFTEVSYDLDILTQKCDSVSLHTPYLLIHLVVKSITWERINGQDKDFEYIYMSLTLTFCFRNLVQGHYNPLPKHTLDVSLINKKRENMLLDKQVKQRGQDA